ncbi:MAG: MATE family efflux transporter [Erysipelotrichaceae bacterium]|nr:MATE family efflux transporter [Erysipelotrichaceae bacterium]
MNLTEVYFGDREYYRNLLRVAIPLALTMLLQSCMSIIDTIMVSSIGMVTAVGNAGNILQLNDGINWGIVSGIAIFAAQFYGAGQKENTARTFGLCLLLMFGNALIWISAVYLFGEKILLFYLNDTELLGYSLTYIRIEIISLLPAAFCFSVSTMFRSEHNTRLPFAISSFGALTNVFLNYLFIYILKWGIAGAAYGTLISTSVNALIYAFIIIRYRADFLIPDKMFDIRLGFIKPVISTMLPIIINETFFGLGMSLFNKAYGLLGTKAMDAVYVANQVFNMFTFAIWGFGSAVSVLVGTTLGQGKIEKAKREAKYQLGSAFVLGSVLSILMCLFAGVYLSFFHISDPSVYNNARNILYVFALKTFIRSFTYMLFSTLKAGGDSRILNLYDSGFMYLIGLPLAFGCAWLGVRNIALLLLIVQLEQVIRLLFTIKRYNSYVWAKDLTKLVRN